MWYIVMAVLIFFAVVCGFFMGLSTDRYLEHEDNNIQD